MTSSFAMSSMKLCHTYCLLLVLVLPGTSMAAGAAKSKNDPAMKPVDNEYAFKYSGGLGTYCDYHAPFAVYRPEVNKTFFCYGGAPADDSRKLLHMVSYFDHATGTVPRPTLLLDKHTDDAHDNPVMAI